MLDTSAVSDAFQYDLAGGNTKLVKVRCISRCTCETGVQVNFELTFTSQWLLELQEQVHAVGISGWSCCIGNGSQDLMFKAFIAFTDPGDPVMIES